MESSNFSRPRSGRRWWRWLGSLLPGVILGCHTPHYGRFNQNPPDVPQGAIPAPSGAYVQEFQNVQAHKAEADDFTIYLYEWLRHGPEPGPYGHYHLDLIAKRLAEAPFPVKIQVSGNPELDHARRAFVVGFLTHAGYPDAELRVHIGFPQANGLFGDEAERIYEDMLFRQDNRLFDSNFGRNTFLGAGGFVPGFGGFLPGFGGIGGVGGIGNFRR